MRQGTEVVQDAGQIVAHRGQSRNEIGRVLFAGLFQHVRLQYRGRQPLAIIIMKVSGDTLTLVFLRREQLVGQGLQFGTIRFQFEVLSAQRLIRFFSTRDVHKGDAHSFTAALPGFHRIRLYRSKNVDPSKRFISNSPVSASCREMTPRQNNVNRSTSWLEKNAKKFRIGWD